VFSDQKTEHGHPLFYSDPAVLGNLIASQDAFFFFFNITSEKVGQIYLKPSRTYLGLTALLVMPWLAIFK
jgi:hypothetical protein